jgi:hypothetical protein
MKKLGFSTAFVGIETLDRKSKEKVERELERCPRVIMITKTADKANLLVYLYGENQSTLRSTIDSLRGFSETELVFIYHSDPPSYPEYFQLSLFPEKADVSPCGKKCSNCVTYQTNDCLGCPATVDYRGPL